MNENSTVNDCHPGWKLSRDCIKDTFIAKRTGVFRYGGTIPAICARNLQLLRETKLTPHKETRMLPNRYRVLQAVKKSRKNECECCWKPFDPRVYINQAFDQYIQALGENDFYLCKSCFESIMYEVNESAADGCAVIFVEGGLVGCISIPQVPIREYVVADYDVFDGGSEEERHDFFVNFLSALKPEMRMIR